jgi:hypothetical protein
VRGAVIPPVVDKDFARHGRIMAWPPRKNPTKNHPSKKKIGRLPGCGDLKICNDFSDDFPAFRGDFLYGQ